MSVEEAVSDGLTKPVDHNAEAAEDAKKLLEELNATTSEDQNPEQEKSATKNGEATETLKDRDRNTTGDDRSRGKGRDYKSRDNGDRRGGRQSYRGKGSHGNVNTRDNIKSVLTTEEKSSDQDAIRKQIEFYFSDSNLPMDKFLFNKVGGSLNNPVEIELIRTFKRMRHFEPLEAIIEALRTSQTLDLVDDDTKVQRKQPLAQTAENGANPDQVRVFEDKAMPRSIYVKGFGPEKPSTQFDVEAFFSPYGPTNAIRLRRTDDKLFKGSVFVEFENEDLANAFLKLDPQPKYQDRELSIMSKKEYCDKKIEDIKAGRIKAGRDRPHNPSHQRKGSRGGGSFKRRRDEDDRDWRTRRDEDQQNGYRDSKGRDRRSGGREGKAPAEKDERGIPVVKSSADDDRGNAKEETLAKARAAVEAEQNKEAETEAKAEGEVISKKRERTEGDAISDQPATKKLDVKTEA